MGYLGTDGFPLSWVLRREINGAGGLGAVPLSGKADGSMPADEQCSTLDETNHANGR